MGPPFLIIDGYNLLHAAGFARVRYGPGDLGRARQRLLALLTERLRSEERRRCCLVFDAQHDAGGRPRRWNHFGISVQFAPAGQDADTEIERLIAHHSASRQLMVISGDHRLQQAAQRRGAAALDSDAFFAELERREAISPMKEAQAPSRSSSPSVEKPVVQEDWRAMFGEIDIAALADEVRREPLGECSADAAEPGEWQSLQHQLDDPEWLERWLRE